jgi:hypothetical protein
MSLDAEGAELLAWTAESESLKILHANIAYRIMKTTRCLIIPLPNQDRAGRGAMGLT